MSRGEELDVWSGTATPFGPARSQDGFLALFLKNILVPAAFQWGSIITLSHSERQMQNGG